MMGPFVLLLLAVEADALPIKPGAPAPLDRFKPGMTEAEVQAVVGAGTECQSLKSWERAFGVEAPRAGTNTGPWCFRAYFDKVRGLQAFALFFSSRAETLAALTRKWGRPREYHASQYWVNPSAKLQVSLWDGDEPAMLHFVPYVPLAQLLGTGSKLAFEKVPIIGAKKAALNEAYVLGCDSETSCRLTLPAVEIGEELRGSIEFQDEVATSWNVDLPAIDETLALLERKWGKRIPDPESPNSWLFSKRKDLMLYRTGGADSYQLFCSREPFR